MRRLVPWLLLLVTGALPGAVVFIEAEEFPYPGDWRTQGGEPNALDRILICTVAPSPNPAVAAVTVPAAGTWRLLVRARDFPTDRPGTRRFAVEINGRVSAKEFGAHANPNPGAQGWQWEDGGTFDLPAGPAVIALRALTAYCRCDALALVSEGDDAPRTVAAAREARRPLPALQATGAELPLRPATAAVGREPLATLANEQVRLSFLPCQVAGAPSVALRAETRLGEEWVETVPASAELYGVVQAAADVAIRQVGGSSGLWPAWEPSRRLPVQVSLGQVKYDTVQGQDQWLPAAGRLQWLAADRAVQATGDRVTLSARAACGAVTATWRLPAGEHCPRLEVRFTAAEPASYGVGYAAGAPVDREQVTEVLCPFLQQYRRLPTEPRLITIENTPTPLAVVQVGRVSRGLAFDPAGLDRDWPDVRQLERGFQLAEPDGRLGPAAWGPIPGGTGAVLQPGESAVLRLCLVATAGDWFEAYRQVATGVFGLRDYRHNDEVSLTDCALNVIDLLKDPQASGWSDAGLAPWNIEGANAVTQAAPLAIVSAALLTGDEALLATRGIPSLAHVLSRSDTHFSVVPGPPGRLGSTRLGQPMALYGSAVRFGAASLCRGYSPAFREAATDPAGGALLTRGYGKVRPFDDAVAAWRATGEPRYREAALADLAAYRDYEVRQTVEVDPSAFYQLSYTGNWEGVLHAGEAFDDPALTAQAAALARRMITGLFTWPAPPAGQLTVHPGGRFEGNGIVWWRGPDFFHLGVAQPPAGDTWDARRLDPLPAPAEQVASWVVSPVGLGIEQPTTYHRLRTACAPILMANWAPGLLRLGAATGEPLFTTAAHNAVLGRYANYPGYYLTGYTTLPTRAQYPYDGPDVSGLYWHHVPPFLAFVLDYLVTDVEVRSRGAVRFPFERQCGYAWFDNRVYGHQPGTVYGTAGVWPWLRRDLVQVSSPRLNWLAGHTADTVYVMLTNTGPEAVTAQVRLDPAATGGAAGPVTARLDNGEPQGLDLTDGRVTVTVAPQGLTVLTWRGCRVAVPFHAEPPAPGAATPTSAAVDSPLGGVHATVLGVDPDHLFLHVWSDHDGSRATQAELVVEQAGRRQTVRRDHWPLECLVPIAAGQPVTVAFTAVTSTGERLAAPGLRVVTP